MHSPEPLLRRPGSALRALRFTFAFAVAASAALTGAAGLAHAEDAPVPAPATLVLKDGRKLDGAVLAETSDAITFRSGGSTRMYARADIERLEKGAARAAEPSAPAAPVAPPAAAGTAPPVPATPPAPPAAREKKNAFGKKGKALSEASRAWVHELAGRAEIEDEQVRRSIAAGLRAFGPIAAPAILEGAAAARTPSARTFLESVAADLGGSRGDARERGLSPAPSAPERAAPSPDTPQPPTSDGPSMGPAPGDSPEDGMSSPPAASEQPPAPDTTRPKPGTGAAPQPFGGPGKDGARPGRAALDRLVNDLELRDDQRLKMETLVGSLERGQLAVLREMRQGTLAPEQVAARIEALRTSSRESAKAFLDPPQYDLFEEQTERYFDGLQVRAARGGAKPGKGGKSEKPEPEGVAPAPETPPAPKSGE